MTKYATIKKKTFNNFNSKWQWWYKKTVPWLNHHILIIKFRNPDWCTQVCGITFFHLSSSCCRPVRRAQTKTRIHKEFLWNYQNCPNLGRNFVLENLNQAKKKKKWFMNMWAWSPSLYRFLSVCNILKVRTDFCHCFRCVPVCSIIINISRACVFYGIHFISCACTDTEVRKLKESIFVSC